PCVEGGQRPVRLSPPGEQCKRSGPRPLTRNAPAMPPPFQLAPQLRPTPAPRSSKARTSSPLRRLSQRPVLVPVLVLVLVLVLDPEPHRVYRRPGYSRGASMGLSSLARQ